MVSEIQGLDIKACPLDHYRCQDGECLPERLRCDSHRDCKDGDDELECELLQCSEPAYFRCLNGRCISSIFKCDEENDCDDFSDELDCEHLDLHDECAKDQFKCDDGLCIKSKWLCDRKRDCLDGSDESRATCSKVKCEDGYFRCRNGECIPETWHCDGTKDCDDGSDEDKCPRRIVSKEDCTLDNRMWLCKDDNLCIEIFEVCSNYNDCMDSSDEGGNCSNTGMCNNKCKHPGEECFRTPDGPVCGCLKGFQRRNGICEDIDECKVFGQCDQRCSNSPGTFSCSCDSGYILQRDDRRCKADGGEALLVYSTTNEVRAFYLTSQKYWQVVNDQKHVIGVAYDGHHIYWTEVYQDEEAIVRAREDGSKMEIIVSAGLGIPEDLAIDWITKNIYFTDSHYQRIGVCKNDGSVCTVIHAKSLDKPRGIALHPKDRYMYWSDWGKNPVIGRSGMDGSMVVDFVNESLHWPNGIVIDYSNNHLYWVDAKLLTIETIKLDGTDRRKILQNTVKHPFSIAVFEDSLFWSDWEGTQIEACNKFTGKERRHIIREKKKRIYGIHVFHPVIQNDDIDNPCSNSSCSDICLLSPKSWNPKQYSCACPEGKSLNGNGFCVTSSKQKMVIVATSDAVYQLGHKRLGRPEITAIDIKRLGKLGAVTYNPLSDNLIMSDTVRKEIISLELGSLQQSTIVSGKIGRIEGLSFDYYGNNLYFTDAENGKVEVVSFSTWERKTLFQRLGGDVPTDIVVIPHESIMFISFFNPEGSAHIDSFSLNGNLDTRGHIIEHDLYGPYLPLHYSSVLNKVFWADSGSYLIEFTDVEGLIRHTFRGLTSMPMSLTSIDSDLFWSVHNSRSIYWADVEDGSSGNKRIDIPGTSTDEIKLTVVTDRMLTDIKHPCLVNNGNCSKICLLDGNSRVCACPDGMLLRKDGLNCMEVPHCDFTQFQCHLSSVSGITKHCIPLKSVCDRIKDCPNGEDELDCKVNPITCPHDMILCRDGSKCISEEQKCNSVYDCLDHSDEFYCNSSRSNEECDNETMFKCSSGECIPIYKRCDSHNNCKDDSDEEDCKEATCIAGVHFRCNSGACIPASYACDNDPDCPDGSDEHAACVLTRTCGPNYFTCENGQCVDVLLRCNGIADCYDESDEHSCPSDFETATVLSPFNPSRYKHKLCGENKEFTCYSEQGKCIPIAARCNGSSECLSGEDEIGCDECKNDEFRCDNGKCILSSWVCDKTNDCIDNSDETNVICHERLVGQPKQPVEHCDGFQCANKKCIHILNVCDGNNDCEDKSDEGGKCGYSCSDAHCTDICHETPSGPKCDCHKGYTLMGDGKSCTDIDECEFGLYCSQYCVNNLGGFQCSCKEPEYLLREDKMSCKAKGSEMEFLFAYENQIRTVSQSHSFLGIVYMNPDFNFKVSGLAADANRNNIYWTSESKSALFKVNTEKRRTVQNVSLSRPSKIAIDWITDNIYLIENEIQIKACNFDSKKCASLYTTEQSLKIDALAVDPITRTMFWSERLKLNKPSSKIYQADLSGLHAKAILSNELDVVSSIFIDSIHKYIYWADSVKQVIERSSFTGTHRQTVFISPDIPIDVALFEDYAYFLVESKSMMRQHSLEKRGNVWQCGLFGSVSWKCEMIRISPVNFGVPYHFEIMHKALQPIRNSGPNDCKNVNCSGLCVLSTSGHVCLCPDGKVMQSNTICSISYGKNNFGVGEFGLQNKVQDDGHGESKFLQWLLILVICLCVPGLIFLVYYTKLFNRVKFWENKTFHSIHFENTSYGLSPVINNTHAESQFHHTKLNPGEHQYENPVNIKMDDCKITDDVVFSADSINGTTGIVVDENNSETSSIEYSDVNLDLHKAPLLG